MKLWIYHLVFILCLASFGAAPAQAKEMFNIMGLKLGDTVERLKEIFPDIEITENQNNARCKHEEIPISNGSWIDAVESDDDQEYSFRLIPIDDVQTIVRGEYAYTSSTLQPEIFKEKLVDKYDFDEITNDQLLSVKDSMSDYMEISHFIIPEGHFFKITEDDVFRLKYTTSNDNLQKEDEKTHTVLIESKMFNSLDETQSEQGEEEKKAKEDECAREELKELAF